MGRKRALRRRRGVTLIEVLIVVAIMAILSAGVGFVVIKQMDKARIKTTITRAQALRSVVSASIALDAGDCPTAQALVEAGDLEQDNRLDAWDREFVVTCEGALITVRSSGSDRALDTPDDIIVPASMIAEN